VQQLKNRSALAPKSATSFEEEQVKVFEEPYRDGVTEARDSGIELGPPAVESQEELTK
jgi:hypothetical protein